MTSGIDVSSFIGEEFRFKVGEVVVGLTGVFEFGLRSNMTY